jgi:hypothetical protein
VPKILIDKHMVRATIKLRGVFQPRQPTNSAPGRVSRSYTLYQRCYLANAGQNSFRPRLRPPQEIFVTLEYCEMSRFDPTGPASVYSRTYSDNTAILAYRHHLLNLHT